LKLDVGRLLRIEPVLVARDAHTFHAGASRAQPAAWSSGYAQTLQDQGGRSYLRRFCLCCNETTPMLMDLESSWRGADGARVLNWRERLICDYCGMNNRQRLIAKLVQQSAAGHPGARIYLMEQVTPIFQWVRRLPATEVHGSEYLGDEHHGGDTVEGVRHEDVMNLSYPDGSFDLIVSNDVMEHIPDPAKALRECCRVLRPGGVFLATFPFQVDRDATVVRAKIDAGGLQHLLPPQFHGNPMSAEGSLVFHDFGWDLLDTMRQAGFSDAACEVYMNDAFGHLGVPVLVFRLTK
jgi:SAM-dependent methyltransferase